MKKNFKTRECACDFINDKLIEDIAIKNTILGDMLKHKELVISLLRSGKSSREQLGLYKRNKSTIDKVSLSSYRVYLKLYFDGYYQEYLFEKKCDIEVSPMAKNKQ